MRLLVNLARRPTVSLNHQIIKNCFNCRDWLSARCSLDNIISVLIKTSLSNHPQNDCNCVNWRENQSTQPRRIHIGPS